jgi:hypothetical protein
MVHPEQIYPVYPEFIEGSGIEGVEGNFFFTYPLYAIRYSITQN